MKKLFSFGMLFVALAICFTSCKREKSEIDESLYCHDIYLLDDFSKMVENKDLIIRAQEAKEWKLMRDTTDSIGVAYLTFIPKEVENDKYFYYMHYLYKTLHDYCWVAGYAWLELGTMNKDVAKQLLNTYGFTKDQVFGNIEGAFVYQGLHPTRKIRMVLKWEPYNGEYEKITVNFAPY